MMPLDQSNNLCYGEDEFLEDKTIWVAELSNGKIVYQDDDRPYVEPSSAWIRLKNYIDEHKLSIDNLFLKFRTHVVEISHHAEGNTFIKAASATWGENKTRHYYICGVLHDDAVIRKWWHVPELVVFKQDVKPINQCLLYLIRNNYVKENI